MKPEADGKTRQSKRNQRAGEGCPNRETKRTGSATPPLLAPSRNRQKIVLGLASAKHGQLPRPAKFIVCRGIDVTLGAAAQSRE